MLEFDVGFFVALKTLPKTTKTNKNILLYIFGGFIFGFFVHFWRGFSLNNFNLTFLARFEKCEKLEALRDTRLQKADIII